MKDVGNHMLEVFVWRRPDTVGMWLHAHGYAGISHFANYHGFPLARWRPALFELGIIEMYGDPWGWRPVNLLGDG